MKLKRVLASVLLACMALSMVACSSSTTTETTTSTTTDTTTSTTTETTTEAADPNPYGLKADGEYSCSDEPIELTAHVHWNDGSVLNDSMVIPVEMANYTNVTLKGVAPEYNSDSTQAFNLIMVEKTLPDIIGGDVTAIAQYGVEGAFIPLNDLIAEYAPNIQAAFELYPEAQAGVTSEDGNIYAIPFIYESTIKEAWFIRQDWLDTLGLDIPETLEEFEDVLIAFRNDDPNGNGEKDEVPLFIRKTSDENILADVLALFGVSDYWHVQDGVVALGSYTEEYKQAITGVSEWYAQGLIDEQILTRGTTVRDELFSEDNGGVTHDWIASTSTYNISMTNYVEDFKLVGMLPPTDVNGDQWEPSARDRITGDGWGITVDNENPVETIKFMDFLFSDQGRLVTTYGIEGETFYYDEDGVPQYTEDLLTNDRAVNSLIMDMGGMIQDMAYLHDSSFEAAIMDEEGFLVSELYLDSGVLSKMNVILPTLSFTEAENDVLTSKYSTCRAYTLEKMQVWLYNTDLIEEQFDDYMDTLAKMGMDEIVAIYQAAYDRAMAL